MEAHHTEEYISFTYQFGPTEVRKLETNPTWDLPVVAHQILSGLDHGELARRLNRPWNLINVQPSVCAAVDLPSLAFRPQDQVLKAIIQLYRYNMSRALDERVRLDQSPVAYIPLKCTVEINKNWHTEPLYTKHPLAGDVSCHAYPYTGLPRFAPLADAGLLVMTAEAFLSDVNGVEDPLISELNDLWEADEIDEYSRLFRMPPPSPSLPDPSFVEEARTIRTKKRKQAGEDSSRPSKRIRAAPLQPPKRSSQSTAKASGVACSPPSRFQDHSDHFNPTPPKRKRVDTQPQACPQVKRAKESPCIGPSPARTVYTRSSKAKGMVKTEAILRPGRVR
ncbi:hypothetical protein CYLTODRAFT_427428 [Cylindrobasidium torrendii FP15055 ss-10]|uniref:Uncharacterized protein n=1 Tax=Cylindrobasidium torrendii FP15055 ss-10 TaxID=1314674 RepID=A0A0D7ATG4_9AGAR|nr:hypothetical protein CYLTODRAFT_427428 [Cylindrobasidium torrendii FP15055 ss-10]